MLFARNNMVQNREGLRVKQAQLGRLVEDVVDPPATQEDERARHYQLGERSAQAGHTGSAGDDRTWQ